MITKMNCAEKKGDDPSSISDFIEIMQKRR